MTNTRATAGTLVTGSVGTDGRVSGAAARPARCAGARRGRRSSCSGAIRQWARILLTLTRPYLGTASSMSKTFAVSTYSGGSSRSEWIERRPALRSRLSCARWMRIWLARASASILWLSDRSGAGGGASRTSCRSPSPWAASLHTASGDQGKMPRIHLDLKLRSRHVEARGRCRGRVCRGFRAIGSVCAIAASGARQATADRRACLRRDDQPRRGRLAQLARDPRAGGGVAEALGADRDERRADVEQIARVRGALHAAHPITGIATRAATAATWASATARIAGPDSPPVPPPSHAAAARPPSPARRGRERQRRAAC